VSDFVSISRLADVSGLNLYLNNLKYNARGVVLAPSTAITNTSVEVAFVTGMRSIFVVQPQASKALLQNVFLRSFAALKRPLDGAVALTRFTGPAPTLANVIVELSELNGSPDTPLTSEWLAAGRV
jgi:hypothetical protein